MPLMDHPDIDKLVKNAELVRELDRLADSLERRYQEVTWAKYVRIAINRLSQQEGKEI